MKAKTKEINRRNVLKVNIRFDSTKNNPTSRYCCVCCANAVATYRSPLRLRLFFHSKDQLPDTLQITEINYQLYIIKLLKYSGIFSSLVGHPQSHVDSKSHKKITSPIIDY